MDACPLGISLNQKFEMLAYFVFIISMQRFLSLIKSASYTESIARVRDGLCKGKMVITASREVYIDNIIKYSLMNLG